MKRATLLFLPYCALKLVTRSEGQKITPISFKHFKGIFQMGTFYAILAFAFWGFSPIFWKFLKHQDPIQVLGHRILWGFVFLNIVILIRNRWHEIAEVFKSRRQLSFLFLSALLISINWFTYCVFHFHKPSPTNKSWILLKPTTERYVRGCGFG